MWPWIYRIIAALLALLGAALFAIALKSLRAGAQIAIEVMGEGARLIALATAVLLLLSAVLILMSPASRRGPRR